jgi:hypothetical protein
MLQTVSSTAGEITSRRSGLNKMARHFYDVEQRLRAIVLLFAIRRA